MTKHVDRLERDGLVDRTPSDADRRRVGLTLTAEGERVLRRVRSRRTAWLASRLRDLDADELAAIEAAVEPLRKLVP
jgi:DNA-binding MarR family transcriptional regulator